MRQEILFLSTKWEILLISDNQIDDIAYTEISEMTYY